MLFVMCPFALGCLTPSVPSLKILPSNVRAWREDLALTPTAEIQGDLVTLRNVRDCEYVGPENYLVRYHDESLKLSDVQSLDYLVVPFTDSPLLAHTMFSFGLKDGRQLAVSAEVRLEEGQEYHPIPGSMHQYELCYVLAEERDLVRLRTRHRQVDVLLYPTIATPEQSQRLLIDVSKRMNKLAAKPEFYDTLTNNCTTNLIDHINHVFPGTVPWSVSTVLPGLSDRYAYDLGLLGNARPFTELKAVARVNELAERYYDDPDFSQRIRMAVRPAEVVR